MKAFLFLLFFAASAAASPRLCEVVDHPAGPLGGEGEFEGVWLEVRMDPANPRNTPSCIMNGGDAVRDTNGILRHRVCRNRITEVVRVINPGVTAAKSAPPTWQPVPLETPTGVFLQAKRDAAASVAWGMVGAAGLLGLAQYAGAKALAGRPTPTITATATASAGAAATPTPGPVFGGDILPPQNQVPGPVFGGTVSPPPPTGPAFGGGFWSLRQSGQEGFCPLFFMLK